MEVEEIIQRTINSPSVIVPDNAELIGGTRESFVQVGCDVFRSLVLAGGLKPTDRVLEIGSGLGRVAYPLTLYIKAPGSYTGLEIMQDAVAFCDAKVAPLSPLFSFKHINYYNEFYNPKGHLKLRDADPGFDASGFDFVFMSSVLTHLVYDDLTFYMSRSSRWLRKGGRLWATAFLIDQATQNALSLAATQPETPAGTLNFDLAADGPDYFLPGGRSTAAVAYRLPTLERVAGENGFKVIGTHLGQWSGVKRAGGYQDLMVLEKV